MDFKKSEHFIEKAEKEFVQLKKKIIDALPMVEVFPIGGTFIPGAITKGDLDVQVRVYKKDFQKALDVLSENFEVNNKHLWNKNFAIFKDESFTPKADILVTVCGSKEDCLQEVQEMIMSDKNILASYNKLKIDFGNNGIEQYKIEKRKFYDSLRKMLTMN